MRTFKLDRIACAHCRKVHEPEDFRPACAACGRREFDLVVERGFSGVDLQNLLDELNYLALEKDIGSLFFKEHSFLKVSKIPGDEVREFLRSTIDHRREQFIAWKREEIEGQLPPNRAVCKRCQVIFTVYDNAWNDSGFCSRNCHTVRSKAEPRRRAP